MSASEEDETSEEPAPAKVPEKEFVKIWLGRGEELKVRY